MDVNYSLPEAAFELPPELVELKNLVRDVVDKECIPLEQDFLTGRPPAGEEHGSGDVRGESFTDGWLPREAYDRLTTVSKQTGLYNINLPVEHGGPGLGVLGAFVVAEELNRCLVKLPICYVPNILYSCNEAQRPKYLDPVIAGEAFPAFAQSEPGAGSDPGNSMSTTAIRKGDGWVINGTKTWISYANRASFFMLQAVTDPVKRQRGGITMFLVDADTPGLTMSPVDVWLTNSPHTFTLYLDDVFVPDSNVLGEVGGGFALGQSWLAVFDRLSRGSLATGALSRGLEIATDWAKNRVTFGEPLSERQAIQWMLTDIYIDLKAIRALCYDCAARADRGEDIRSYAAMCKFVGANWGHRSMDNIMQILGGIGETTETPIPHWYRQLRHGRIGGGTDEIQRILMSRAILKQGKSLWQA
ncbi:acyl-CoA dehydrogenase [Rhodococcus wratislaviensis]|uniref:Acyl-CoA dehydrogenase n=1 Tax=Rhodococcus wratislaviensis TaxID=44752 RepID=A0AB38FD94_RHOWR|nr:acyl-CoA dehydrogenase family protein [Rhodococcus wratislaviensis]REE75484.1 acyl-CoA dehydrogenase [Rhodococcus wratislaviensis]SPZ39481.1 acyl-CoA dehydrogenase [Rhodococcus wratislaviensis]